MTLIKRTTAAAWAVFCVSVLSLSAQDRLTLRQFVDEAVLSSPALEIAGEAVAGAELKVQEAKSLYYPQVNFASSYTRLSLVSKFSFPIEGKMQEFKFVSPNNYSFRLSASEPLFTWGRIEKAVELSKAGVALSQDNVALARQALAYQVVPIFYGVLFSDETLKVLDETLGLFERKLATLEERYKAGIASDFEISLVQVQISSLHGQQLDIRNSVRKLMMTYNRIAGRPLDREFVCDGELRFEPVAADAQALAREAAAQRIEYRLLRNQKALVQTQMALAKTANKPNLVAAFNYEFKNGFMPNIDTIRGNWNAVLAVSYPVFDGQRTAAQVAQSEVALRTVEEQEADVRRSFELDIRQGLADLKTIEDKIGIERLKIEHAAKAFKISEERYQNGLLSMTDLIETQNALDAARLNLLQLIYSHILGKFGLDRAAGRAIHS